MILKTKMISNNDAEKNDGIKLVFADDDSDISLSLFLTADAKIYTKTNTTNTWKKADKSFFKTTSTPNASNVYTVECAVSLKYLKSLGIETEIPLNVTLIDALSDKEIMIESVANCTEDKSTWLRMTLE